MDGEVLESARVLIIAGFEIGFVGLMGAHKFQREIILLHELVENFLARIPLRNNFRLIPVFQELLQNEEIATVSLFLRFHVHSLIENMPKVRLKHR